MIFKYFNVSANCKPSNRASDALLITSSFAVSFLYNTSKSRTALILRIAWEYSRAQREKLPVFDARLHFNALAPWWKSVLVQLLDKTVKLDVRLSVSGFDLLQDLLVK